MALAGKLCALALFNVFLTAVIIMAFPVGSINGVLGVCKELVMEV